MTIKIDQKITGYSIAHEGDGGHFGDQEEGERAAPKPMPIERPDDVWGRTFKLKTPVHDHAMYMTVNHITMEDGSIRPFELFLNTKDPQHGHIFGVLARTASAVWRQGGDFLFLLDEWEEVHNPSGGFMVPKRGYCPSLVALIGWTLRDHFKDLGIIGNPGDDLTDEQKAALQEHIDSKAGKERKQAVPAEDKTPPKPESETGEPFQCKECKEFAVYILDGCPTCTACGDSKCG